MYVSYVYGYLGISMRAYICVYMMVSTYVCVCIMVYVHMYVSYQYVRVRAGEQVNISGQSVCVVLTVYINDFCLFDLEAFLDSRAISGPVVWLARLIEGNAMCIFV